MKTLVLFFLFLRCTEALTFPPQQRQWASCNNCFAVVARDIILWHQPRLNLTVRDIMKETGQTCAGGVPTTAFDLYFPRGSQKTSGSLRTLQRVLRKHGPCAINVGKGHLVTAVRATEHGIVVRDPADGRTKLIRPETFASRHESVYFSYIAYPLR
jgi:hypothetical protein